MVARNVWSMVENVGQKYIPLKWVFKVKEDGRFREILVSLGYKQIAGIDYDEIHAPVISDVGFRLILFIGLQKGWEIKKMDVEASFLLGKLEEKTFIKIPKGFKNEGKIACLNSAIYGLSQASRVFHQTLRNYLVKE